MRRLSFRTIGTVIAGVCLAAACGDSTGAGAGGGSTTGSTTGTGGDASTTSTTTTGTTTATTSAGGGGTGGTGVGGSGGSGPAGTCATPDVLTIPSIVQGDTLAGTDALLSNCNSGTAKEVVYSFTAGATGDLHLVLETTSGADLGLSVRSPSCTTDTDEIDCADDNIASNEELSVAVTSGATYFVIVDGYDTGEEGTYTLYASVGDEALCNNYVDDDVDGDTDCADATTCSATAACTNGTGATGTACTLHNGCLAADPHCLNAANSDFPAGYCSQWCNLAADDCPVGSECFDLNLGSNGLCLDTCLISGDCRTNYTCQDRGGVGKACYPNPCQDATAATLGANAGNTSTGHDRAGGTCESSGNPGKEHVYTFTPATTGTLTLTLTSLTDQGLSVRTLCDDQATEVACEDNETGGVDEVLTTPVVMNVPIFILVEAYNAGAEGAYSLNIAIN